MRLHAKIQDMPNAIKSALSSVGYTRKDIAVHAAETCCLAAGGGQGRREFAIVVNLATGERKETWGSWGGANMFNPQNAVDLDTRAHPIPSNCVVIQGSVGESVYASIVALPTTLAPLLPAKADTTEKEQRILYAYGSLKSGPYRKQSLDGCGTLPSDIDSLVARGLLSRNRGGAVQITTEGKNARDGKSRY